MRGPAAGGQCGGRAAAPALHGRVPFRRRFSLAGPPSRQPGRGAGWPQRLAHPRLQRGSFGPAPRGGGRCGRPTLGFLLLPHRGRVMPPGVEALDLPAWNGASGLCWGPRHRSVPLGLGFALLERPGAPPAFRGPSPGCSPPGVFGRPLPAPPPGSATLPPASRGSGRPAG